MRRWLAAWIAVFVSLTPISALGDDGVDANADTHEGQFGIWVQEGTGGEAKVVDESEPIGEYHVQPACKDICAGDLTCPDGTFKIHSWYQLPNGDLVANSYWCPSDGAPQQVTDGLVATAFRRVPLPPSTFSIQPPGGKTLVNFDTNFFTEKQALDRTVRLLGQRVDLRIRVHSYVWHFGDGESITTDKPGAPYPKLLITHNYLRKGSYAPTMDTTWVADYRVGGGSWKPVPGSVTIVGTAVDLRAVEARPTLVGYSR